MDMKSTLYMNTTNLKKTEGSFYRSQPLPVMKNFELYFPGITISRLQMRGNILVSYEISQNFGTVSPEENSELWWHIKVQKAFLSHYGGITN